MGETQLPVSSTLCTCIQKTSGLYFDVTDIHVLWLFFFFFFCQVFRRHVRIKDCITPSILCNAQADKNFTNLGRYLGIGKKSTCYIRILRSVSGVFQYEFSFFFGIFLDSTDMYLSL
jgi:hypothetical protein